MVGELLAIAAAYGTGICLIHLLHGRLLRREAFHVVIVTNHAASTIEWHLRSIAFLSLLKARNTVVTVLDEGSMDDTVMIARRLALNSRLWWNVVTVSSSEEATEWLKQAQGVDQVIRVNGLSASGSGSGTPGDGGTAEEAASVP